MTPPAARLTAISPAAITAYLACHGWRQETIRPNHSAVWYLLSPQGHTAATVLVPMRSDWADYAARVLDVLRTCATVEQRPGPEWSVLADMEAQP